MRRLSSKTVVIALAVLAAVVLLVAGCARSQPSPSPAPKPAPAPAPAPAPKPTAAAKPAAPPAAASPAPKPTAAPKPQVIELKLGHWTPAGGIWDAQYQAFSKEVEQKSGGRVKIIHYPNSALGPPLTEWDLLRKGALQMSQWLPVYFPGKYPLSEMFSLPFISYDAKTHLLAMHDLTQRGLLDKVLYDEVKVIAAGFSPANNILTRGREVKVPNDLKGVKIRGLGGTMTASLEKAGATAVTVPYPEIYSAMEKGVVESVMTDWVVVVDNHLDDFVKYAVELYAMITTDMFIMNKETYEKLPKDLQKIFDEAGYNSIFAHLEASDKRSAQGKELITKKGGKIYVPTEAEKKLWVNTFQPVWDDWLKQTEGKGLSGKKLLHEYGLAVKANGGKWAWDY